MVRDGVVVVLPLYLLVLVLEVMVVIPPLTFLCHCTLVMARLEDTVHFEVKINDPCDLDLRRFNYFLN
jgi:hypothetical protein